MAEGYPPHLSQPTSTEEELQALRRAAERGDGNGCWDTARQLLRQMPTRWAMRLVRDFLARRLPVFERHQPGVLWPREFIESVTQDGMVADDRTWPEAESDFPGPGANSFISAVEALWKASHLRKDEHQRSELLANAMDHAVGAEQLESWGSRHPDEWALWYQLASTGLEDPRIVDIQITIMKDPEAVRVEREAWMEAAQHLEEALSASSRSPS
jgi:hypothetical protein